MRRAFALLVVLALGGCGDDLGPLLMPGPYYGIVYDMNMAQMGTLTFSADSSSKIDIHVEGVLSDGMSPFRFDVVNGEISRDGSNFNINGNVVGMGVTGYGRQRVFDYMLEVLAPFDDDPTHRLVVGSTEWTFGAEGAISPSGGQGLWNARAPKTGQNVGGYWMIAPGIAPDGGPDAAPMDGSGDAPVDAGTD